MSQIRRALCRCRPSLPVALTVLFLALSGSAYAAFEAAPPSTSGHQDRRGTDRPDASSARAGSPGTAREVSDKLGRVDRAGPALDADRLERSVLAALQRRITGMCSGDRFMRAVRRDGTVRCGPAGDITSVHAGNGLTGGGTSRAVALDVTAPLSLSAAGTEPVLGLTATGSGPAVTARSVDGAGIDVSTSGEGSGVISDAPSGTAVQGSTSNIATAALLGRNTAGEAVVGVSSGGTDVGAVVGRNDGDGPGVRGYARKGGAGVLGLGGYRGGTGPGVRGEIVNAEIAKPAVEALTIGKGPALQATSTNPARLAARFDGDVTIAGNLTVTGVKTGFLIDDPLDPEGHTLAHTPVESDDYQVTYSGNVRTDRRGLSTVHLPRYADAVASDWRYGLTTVGSFARAIVQREMHGGRFVVRTDRPRVKVSWILIGTRRDPFAQAHPFTAERPKPTTEHGRYLHPAELDGSAAPAPKAASTNSKPPQTNLASERAANGRAR